MRIYSDDLSVTTLNHPPIRIIFSSYWPLLLAHPNSHSPISLIREFKIQMILICSLPLLRHRKLPGDTATLLATGHLRGTEQHRRRPGHWPLHLQLELRRRRHTVHAETDRTAGAEPRVYQRYRLLAVRSLRARVTEHREERDRRTARVRAERELADHRTASVRLHCELRATEKLEHLCARGRRTVWSGAELSSKCKLSFRSTLSSPDW